MKLLWEPNKHAPKSKIYSFLNRFFWITGYQRFYISIYTKKPKPVSNLLSLKSDLIEHLFYESICKREDIDSFLDIGCNNGYFTHLAKYFGIVNVKGIDIDAQLSDIYKHKVYKDISFELLDYHSLDFKSDVVLALSLTHWLIGQKLDKGEDKSKVLDSIFAELSKITNKILILEFVLSSDKKVVNYKHFDIEVTVDDYKKYAKKYFNTIEKLGNSSPTRPIYALYK